MRRATRRAACPPTRFGERHCLAITSASALYCGATLLVERWANPLFELGPADGAARARVRRNGAQVLTWITLADQQLCAHLLLLLFTARRTLVHCSKGGEGLRAC